MSSHCGTQVPSPGATGPRTCSQEVASSKPCLHQLTSSGHRKHCDHISGSSEELHPQEPRAASDLSTGPGWRTLGKCAGHLSTHRSLLCVIKMFPSTIMKGKKSLSLVIKNFVRKAQLFYSNGLILSLPSFTPLQETRSQWVLH